MRKSSEVERIPVKGSHSRARFTPRRPDANLRHDSFPSTPLRCAIEAAAALSSRHAAIRWPLGRRTAGRHHPRIGIRSADGVSRPRSTRRSAARPRATSCQQQRPDGGWSNYPDGPADLSVSVKAYFALKLTGHDPDAPHMRRARAVIRSLGGAAGCNSFTKFYLALLGQFPYGNCAVRAAGDGAAAALVLRQPLRDVELDAHHRRAAQHLLGVQTGPALAGRARDPRTVPRAAGNAAWPAPPTRRWFSWTNFFLGVDCAVQEGRARGLGPIRRVAVRRAAAWMREHFEDSDGLGAIFPPMIYTVIALRCLGVGRRRPGDAAGR